jgi:hypothetical protein
MMLSEKREKGTHDKKVIKIDIRLTLSFLKFTFTDFGYLSITLILMLVVLKNAKTKICDSTTKRKKKSS